ncbi:putative drug exporters of the RND superfamily [Methanocella conradii HZ254]|uniref:Drug exporters of the RND superfamily n=1 Tax=Methanocella conradii (strain DSM 24694 / JCM 17849 / CGMCC 1.5162 / HZ254) TaxID=1041930 RepID=H8I979_METCZ|nr:efflux RND transporter permease subunit [Methanocella conradii]AFC99082.1 putative drug exporters of the RND superfamily [Methanocella conradii HZ254]
MVSIFSKLGEVVTRHPWAIIAIWAIALIISLPLVGMFTGNLQYDVQKFIPKDLGSYQAKDKYDEQFPGNYKNQILVVVESDNKTAAMHFIDELDGRVKGDAAIRNVTGTSSIYSVQRDAVVNMTPDLYRGLYDAFDNASDGNRKLWNATDTVLNTSNSLYWLWDNVTEANSEFYKARKMVVDSSAKLYSARDQVVAASNGMYQIKDAADLVYGIPAVYVYGFNGVFNGSNVDQACAAGYNATMRGAVNPISDQQSKAIATGWLDTFNATWYGRVSANQSAATDPTLAGQVISSAGPAYFDHLGLPAQQQGIFDGVLQFGMDRWQNGDSLKYSIVGLTMQMQGLTSDQDRARLASIYDLGRNPSDAAILTILTAGASDKKSIEDIFYLGRNPSDGAIGNYLVNKAIAALGENATQEAKDVLWDAWNIGPTATKQDFDDYVLKKVGKGLNQTEKQSLQEIYGWGPNPNESIVRAYVLREAGKGLNATENQTLAEIYDLGRCPDNETIKKYVVSKTMTELNLSCNDTYFMALLGLERNMSEEQLKDFARAWEAEHGYDDPMILPHSVVDSLASGNVTLYIVSTSDYEEAESSIESVKEIRSLVSGLLKEDGYNGVKAYVTGTTAMSVDTEKSAMDDVNNIDKVTIVLVLILLGLYFRSFLTPFIPLVIIGIAVAVAFGFMGVVSAQIDVFYLVMTFMVVIMLGAGTDYCVFMLSRYAEERSKGAEVIEAVRTTVANAGKSIASSGSTAMIGFGSLMLIDRGVFQSIGIGTATSILFSMLVALTLVPAVLTVAGDRVFWPRKLYNAGPGITAGIWRGITSRVLKHAKAIIIIAFLVTVPAVYIYGHLELGNDFVSMMPESAESKIGYDLLNENFGSGALEKGMVIATLPEPIKVDGNYSPEALDRVERLSALIADTPGVDKVYSMTRPEGATIDYDNLSAYKGAEKEFYEDYMNDSIGADGRTTLIYVAFNGSPFSLSSQKAIDEIKEKLKAYQASEGAGTTLLMGGGAVGTYEYQRLCTDKYSLVIPVVLIGIFIVLMLLLRSLFTPARLITTLLLSIAWTLAIFILVFQVWLNASVYWILPIILFCVLMGLGVDYDIFLVSRIREEAFKGRSDEEAIEHAVESTGTIITLCGLVMAAAFGSMMISGTIMLKEFGFVLCLAILMDATLMRLVVVPSIMVLLKKYNWWMPFVKDERAAIASTQEAQKPK